MTAQHPGRDDVPEADLLEQQAPVDPGVAGGPEMPATLSSTSTDASPASAAARFTEASSATSIPITRTLPVSAASRLSASAFCGLRQKASS